MNTPFNRKKDSLDDMHLPKSQQYLWRFLKFRAFRTHEEPFWQKFFQRPRVFIPSMAFAVLMVLLFQPFFDFLPFLDRSSNSIIFRTAYAQDDFQLEPVSADSTGVDSTTIFTLKSEEPIPVEDISSALQISEDVPFEVSEKAPGEYQIELQEALLPSEVVKFSLQASYQDLATGAMVPHDFTWGFQVKDTFKVISTLPADKATSVPLNTGIEIRFSHENFENFESFFEIFPATKGTFEKHFRTLVFVPEGLSPHTLYTVTLKKGLPLKDSEQTLEEDYRFQVETDDKGREDVYLDLGPQMREFSLNEAPAFEVYYSTRFGRDDGEVRLPVTVYRYNDGGQFLQAIRQYYDLPSWAYQSRRNFLSSTQGLQEVLSADIPLVRVDYSWHFSLPEALSQGYYLVEMNAGSSRAQTWMQITDLAGYSTVSKTKSLIWVNDVSTSSPVKDATIEILDSNERFSTDENGLVSFDTSDFLKTSVATRFLNIQAEDGKQLFVVLTNGEVFPASNYWSFLFLDRPMYLPNDTVRFWGFLQHRDGSEVQKLRVAVENPGYAFDVTQPPLIEKEFEVDRGSFTGEFEIQDFLPGGYALKVYIGDLLVLDRWFEVQTYVKPAYKIDLTSNKDAVFYGENLDFDILSSFFEGTPVPNMLLQYQAYWNGNSGDVRTDTFGKAQVSLPITGFDFCKTPDDNKFCPFHSNFTLSVSPKFSEEGQISESENIEVFFSHVELEAETKALSDSEASVTTKAFLVDLDTYNQNSELGYRGGAALNQKIQGEVIREDWKKMPDGNFYDFISKKVVPKFRYENTEKVVDSFSGTTNDRGEFSYNFPLAPGGNYRVKVWTYDDKNNLSFTSSWIWREQNYPDRFYSLQEQNYSQDDYDLGQDVILDFYQGNELLPQKSSYLYFRSTNGIRDYELSDTPRYQFSFAESDIPSTSAEGIWFDGKHYFQGNSLGIRFREDSRRLKIEVVPDKDEYKPGEDVQLSVKISDSYGNPVSASVNLNLVDEAYYKLFYSSNPPDPLAELYYSFVDSGVLSQYGSHYYPEVESDYGGKGGGGGAWAPRQNFEDTALFTVIQTGIDGITTTRFKLPDNLTSWRLTAQAVNTDLQAGFSSSHINVSLPLFVDTVNAKTYLKEDKPILSVRAFGKDLEDVVDFTVSLHGGKEQNLIGKVFEASKFSLIDLFSRGELEEGQFKLQSTVKQGDKKDSMIEPFTVLTSRFTQPKLWTEVLRSGLKLQGNSQGRTQLTVSDLGRGEVYAALKKMAFQEGDRIDQLLARKISAELLQKEFQEPVLIPESDFLRYQDQQGGISLLPYSSPELMLSADLAAFAQDTFDVNRLKNYFYSVVDSSKSSSEEIVLALYGLASIDEPVLILLEKASETLKLDVVSRLYLGLAFAELGDRASARNIFTEIFASAEIRDQDIFLPDTDRDQAILKTALLADLAVKVQTEESHKLWNFVQKNVPEDFLLYPYELHYAASRIEHASPQDVSFTLRVGERILNETLENGEIFRMDLSSSELRDAELDSFSGDIFVTTFFEEPRSDIKTDPRITLRRAYYVDDKPVTTFKEGDLVQVRLYPDIRAFSLQSFEALEDSMEVSVEAILKPFIANEIFFVKDILPSGLTAVTLEPGFVRYDEQGCHLGGLSQVRDQIVTFSLSSYGFSSCGQNDFMYYYARVLNTGEYKAEPAMIFSADNPSILNITESTRVIIE